MKIEENPSGYAPSDLGIDKYDEETISYHIYIMLGTGLIDGGDSSHMGCSSPQGIATNLTWQGHKFLDASRDPTR